MRQHFVTIPTHDSVAAEEELNRFLASHRVVSVDREFIADGARSAWAICVSWVETPGAKEPLSGDPKRARIDYRELLPADEFAVFAIMRDTRKVIAERDAVPPYAVFTNEQFAEMVRRRVRTAEELALIEGVGPVRIEKYGATFLDIARTLPALQPKPLVDPPAATSAQ